MMVLWEVCSSPQTTASPKASAKTVGGDECELFSKGELRKQNAVFAYFYNEMQT